MYLGELYIRYSSFVLAVCMKYLQNKENSKDAVMDVFEKLTNSLTNQNIKNFKAWLYTVAKNHCLMAIRANKSKSKHYENLQIEQEFFMENDENMHQAYEEEQFNNVNVMEKAIELLNEGQKKCIKMFYYEDKSYAEIVKKTGFELKKVKSCLQNGKRNLKLVLEKEMIKND
ncbi:MAG: sigma-70 family RNA polymerase sigma factor [Chlorobi bacterium]|nr:sigma-70 family RNA polymerase sigma factor [Chlorobiota bacterium]